MIEMNEMMSASLLVAIAACLSGLALGLVFFAALKRSTDSFATHDNSRAFMLAMLTRLGIAVTGFVLIAQAGALALVMAFAGFLIARTMALSNVRAGA